jgi:hypothetical protein
VAALTMPNLIANYQKKVLETRIKKFYSVLNQAATTKIAEAGALDAAMIKTTQNPAQLEEFFNMNFAPYMKTTETKKLNKGFVAAFPDGAGMYMNNASMSTTDSAVAYILFCPDYKNCKNIDETGNDFHRRGNGKNVVGRFYANGVTDLVRENFTRQNWVDNCSNYSAGYCAALLQLDGWEIKDDYPWF